MTHTWDITPRLTLSDGARRLFITRGKFRRARFLPLFAEKFGKVTQNNATYSLSAGLTFSATDDGVWPSRSHRHTECPTSTTSAKSSTHNPEWW